MTHAGDQDLVGEVEQDGCVRQRQCEGEDEKHAERDVLRARVEERQVARIASSEVAAVGRGNGSNLS